MGRRVKIPWIGGQNTMGRDVNMPWIEVRGFDIPWVGVKIPWVGGLIYHG
jgi:hypothetical protein